MWTSCERAHVKSEREAHFSPRRVTSFLNAAYSHNITIFLNKLMAKCGGWQRLTHTRARTQFMNTMHSTIHILYNRTRTPMKWKEKKYKLKIKCYLLHCWRECRMLWLFINQSGAHILSTQGRTIKKSDFPPPLYFTPLALCGTTRCTYIWKMEHNSAEEDAPVYDYDDAVHIYRLDRRVYCLSRILIVLPYA